MTTKSKPITEFTILVSRPCAALRSNGGHGNRYVINEASSKAKMEAYFAVLFVRRYEIPAGTIIYISYTEVLGPRERAMDNLIVAMKSYRDGIALALGINDKHMRVRPCGVVERGDVGGVRCRVWWE